MYLMIRNRTSDLLHNIKNGGSQMTTVWFFTRSHNVYYFRTYRDAMLARLTGDGPIMERQITITV